MIFMDRFYKNCYSFYISDDVVFSICNSKYSNATTSTQEIAEYHMTYKHCPALNLQTYTTGNIHTIRGPISVCNNPVAKLWQSK